MYLGIEFLVLVDFRGVAFAVETAVGHSNITRLTPVHITENTIENTQAAMPRGGYFDTTL